MERRHATKPHYKHDAGDISGDMTTEEEEELSIRISEYLNSYYEDRD